MVILSFTPFLLRKILVIAWYTQLLCYFLSYCSTTTAKLSADCNNLNHLFPPSEHKKRVIPVVKLL